LGSHIVGEVILCAIRFNDINWWAEQANVADWSINKTQAVTLLEIASYV
jgi:hypothetical protein